MTMINKKTPAQAMFTIDRLIEQATNQAISAGMSIVTIYGEVRSPRRRLQGNFDAASGMLAVFEICHHMGMTTEEADKLKELADMMFLRMAGPMVPPTITPSEGQVKGQAEGHATTLRAVREDE